MGDELAGGAASQQGFAGWNPYAPALEMSQAAAARRQSMAQKLMQGQPQAPGGYGVPAPTVGGDEAFAGGSGSPLAGMDLKALAQAFKAAPGEVPGADGFQSGLMGTGIGGWNSTGADTLQGMGFYNPLPQS